MKKVGVALLNVFGWPTCSDIWSLDQWLCTVFNNRFCCVLNGKYLPLLHLCKHFLSLLGTVCILGCRGAGFAGVQALCVEPLRGREEWHCPQPQLWYARELQWLDVSNALVKCWVRLALFPGGGERKRGWYTLLAHAPSFLGNLHTSLLH